MCKVSVIVPMYNVAKVLEPCVRSLCAQTLSGIELIFIDDCSADGTQEVLERLLGKFAKPRKDISVKTLRHERNRGVAAARNTGVDAATGDFIAYVDADDSIEPDALEKMYSRACADGADIVVCEWMMDFAGNSRRMHQPDVNSGEQLFTKIARGVLRWNLWLFLVRRSLYGQDIRFIEGQNMGEDLMVMSKLALRAGKVSVLHEPLYHYVQTNGDALTKNFIAYKAQVSANAAEVQRYVTEQYGSRYLPEVYQMQLTIKLPLLISDDVTKYREWLEWFPESNSHAGENPDISGRTRMLQKAAVKGRFLLIKLYYRVVIKFVYGVLYR